MELFTCSILISCALVSILYIWRILNWVWFTPKSIERRLRSQGFTGNPYRMMTGDLKEIAVLAKNAQSRSMEFTNDIMPRVYFVFHRAFQKFGKKSFVWFGPRPALVITEPEVVREILLKNYIFQKIPGSPLTSFLGKGLVMLETELWAKHRKLINPAFQVQKLKLMVGSFHLSCTNMLKKWDELATTGGSIELDVWPYLSEMTSDVIARAAFGSSYNQGGRIFHLQKQQAESIIQANRSLHFPGWRYFPTKENKRLKNITEEIESIFRSIITARMEEEAGVRETNDLLGVLLESNAREMKENGAKFGMSMKDVIEECKIFFFAGQDTSATLLVWTMLLLSKHQDWQARARDEVLEAFGKRKPDYEELSHLKIVTMIVHEVLRLYPPIVMLARLTEKDGASGKVRIPAGVQLMLPVLLLHHDPEIWGEDAKEFNPERFAQGVSEATKGRLTYLPFGWGPRVCIAQNFALLQAKMALATILQNYSFRLSPSYLHAPHTVVSLQPQYGAPLFLTKI
ncbi:cytochrome P450 CYP72A219-like [Salvia hispanica]|uniref:cytochrome P450 CYP72A219-like n=1 Tax=Salvia hispanica TaxID=49212 RepID=UPI002009A1EB|nr:cytochrome P450 CYP72A219-like [Salvia hispanica]